MRKTHSRTHFIKDVHKIRDDSFICVDVTLEGKWVAILKLLVDSYEKRTKEGKLHEVIFRDRHWNEEIDESGLSVLQRKSRW